MLKRCSSCGEAKELNSENFGIKRSLKSGFDSRCKACRKAYDKKRYQENRERLNNESKQRYRKNSETRKEYARRYYAENREKCKKSIKKWDKAHPVQRRIINESSRTKKYGADSTLTNQEWAKIKSLFTNSCAYCGLSESECLEQFGEKLHHEHIIPLADGGDYAYGNVVPACRSCNSSKANQNFSIWYKTSGVFSEERNTKISAYIERSKN